MIERLPDDPPAIDVPPLGTSNWTDYFNLALKCGDLPEEKPGLSLPLPYFDGDGWRPGRGCGARNWEARPTFWYPRPGQQFEITCLKCRNTYGVEVRTERTCSPSARSPTATASPSAPSTGGLPPAESPSSARPEATSDAP
jgi:hypothetical protein